MRCNKYKTGHSLLVEDNTVEAALEPLDSLVLGDLVGGTNTASLVLLAGDAVTGTGHHNVEVHAVNADGGVVLDAQVNVLLDTETEVAGSREVTGLELVLKNLETTLEDLLGLGAADGAVHGDLFVTTNAERADGVAGLGVDGLLSSKLLKHLGGASEPVTRFTNANVEAELLEAELAHGVLLAGFFGLIKD